MHVHTAMEGSLSSRSEVAAVSPTVANTTDLTQVLSGLQQSGDLNTVLQQQPQLVEGTAWPQPRPAGIMCALTHASFQTVGTTVHYRLDHELQALDWSA